jgi:hypothetical protein
MQDMELNDAEMTALIKVRKDLADGRYRHFASYRRFSFKKLNMAGFGWPADCRIFSMDRYLEEYSCGTVGCIGGWMLHELRMYNPNHCKMFYFAEGKPRLWQLFYGCPDNIDRHLITPRRAVRAIDNYILGHNIWGPYLTADNGPDATVG